MARETVGLIMVDWKHFTDTHANPLVGLAYLPVEQLPDGRVQVYSPALAKTYAGLGLTAVTAVACDVKRQGTQMIHTGYVLHFLESTPSFLREHLVHLGAVLIDGVVKDFYDRAAIARSV